MIFNSPFEYDVIETFVRVHEELVYSICSRTRSPSLWDVLKLWKQLYLIAFIDLIAVAKEKVSRIRSNIICMELVEEYSKGKIHKSEPEPGNGNVNTVYFVRQARGNTRVCLR